MTYRNLFTNFAKSLRCQALESKTFHDVNRKTWGSKNLQIITPKKYLGIHKRKNFGDGAIIHNGLGLCVRAGNRSSKAEFITIVQQKNYC